MFRVGGCSHRVELTRGKDESAVYDTNACKSTIEFRVLSFEFQVWVIEVTATSESTLSFEFRSRVGVMEVTADERGGFESQLRVST